MADYHLNCNKNTTYAFQQWGILQIVLLVCLLGSSFIICLWLISFWYILFLWLLICHSLYSVVDWVWFAIQLSSWISSDHKLVINLWLLWFDFRLEIWNLKNFKNWEFVISNSHKTLKQLGLSYALLAILAILTLAWCKGGQWVDKILEIPRLPK